VLNEAPKIAQDAKKSMCYVHSLVEKSQKGSQGPKLPGIKEEEHGRVDKLRLNGDVSPPQDHTQSRLLTKKQLSDMAMSVRSLAKKLGSLRVKLKIRSVFLLTKAHDQTLIGKTRDVAKWLLSKERDVPYIIYVENTLEHNKAFDAEGLLRDNPEYEGRLKYWNNELAKRKPHTFDFVVTLGGDGTVLYASWLFQRVVPPVLSFALGSLGFLTKFDFNQYEDTLTRAFRDGVTISLRLRFEGTIMRSQKRPDEPERRDLVEELVGEEGDDHRTHKPERTFEILNDIVVDRGPNPTMSTIELFGDEEHLTTVQADGICVATPTGSTAYNLAAGGSLCHPENPVILVTAICAHTLSFRPVILPDSMVLRIGVPYDARANSWVSFDGRERVELCPGDYVTISASRYPFANVMPPGRRSEDWINSLSRTLQWNSRQRQKAFNEWDEADGKQDADDVQTRKRAGEGHGGFT
jgi:NAD+ kinase